MVVHLPVLLRPLKLSAPRGRALQRGGHCRFTQPGVPVDHGHLFCLVQVACDDRFQVPGGPFLPSPAVNSPAGVGVLSSAHGRQDFKIVVVLQELVEAGHDVVQHVLVHLPGKQQIEQLGIKPIGSNRLGEIHVVAVQVYEILIAATQPGRAVWVMGVDHADRGVLFQGLRPSGGDPAELPGGAAEILLAVGAGDAQEHPGRRGPAEPGHLGAQGLVIGPGSGGQGGSVNDPPVFGHQLLKPEAPFLQGLGETVVTLYALRQAVGGGHG